MYKLGNSVLDPGTHPRYNVEREMKGSKHIE
jgi:hypothetical protein